MSFLALIIALSMRQLWGAEPWLHRDSWWYGYRERVAALGVPGWIQLGLAVVLPTLLLGIFLDVLAPVLFGLPWILLAAVVLLYSFGRGDFQARIAQYRGHCERGNYEAAWLYLCGELEADDLAVALGSASADAADLRLQERLLYDGYQRWFAVVFWFVLLGPAWAFGYRLLQMSVHGVSPSPCAAQLLHWVDWLPVRVLAITFTLAGDFVRSHNALREAVVDTSSDAPSVLRAVGASAAYAWEGAADSAAEAAIGVAGEMIPALSSLLTRSGVVWVVAIALVAIID